MKPDPNIFLEPTIEANIKATIWMASKTMEDIARRQQYLARTDITSRERSIVSIKLADDERYLGQMRRDLAMLQDVATQRGIQV